MNKILAISLMGSFILSSFAFGADFSKKTNDELVNLSGVVEPKDILDYKKEIKSRVKNMTKDEAKAFNEKLKVQRDKVYDDMKVKDLKQRKEAIFNAIKEQCGKDPASCPKNPHKMESKPGKCDGKDMHKKLRKEMGQNPYGKDAKRANPPIEME